MSVYDPSPDEVEAWVATGKPTPWPEQDWDYYVSEGRNDDVIFKYANDAACPCHDFFEHCLYLIVGDFREWHREDTVRNDRIQRLISRVDSTCSSTVQKWKNETIAMLAGDAEFVLSYWIDHLYYDDTQAGQITKP